MVYFAVLIILVFFVVYFGFTAFANSMKPYSPEECVKILKSFLGLQFSGEYKIIECDSQNNHPDRPLKVIISLTPIEFEKIKTYLNNIELTEYVTYSKNGKVKYVNSWKKYDNEFFKSHITSSINPEVPYFIADLRVDCDNNIIYYDESGV